LKSSASVPPPVLPATRADVGVPHDVGSSWFVGVLVVAVHVLPLNVKQLFVPDPLAESRAEGVPIFEAEPQMDWGYAVLAVHTFDDAVV